MNGGLGRRTYGFCSTRETVNDAPSSRVARPRAVSSSRASTSAPFSFPSGPKSRPCATRFPSSPTSRASNDSGSNVAARSHQPAATNAIRSRSRSTTSRVATDCTRPAESPRMIFFQSTGEIS